MTIILDFRFAELERTTDGRGLTSLALFANGDGVGCAPVPVVPSVSTRCPIHFDPAGFTSNTVFPGLTDLNRA